MIKHHNQTRSRTWKKPVLITAVTVLVAAGILAALELTGITSFILNSDPPVPRTANQNTKGEGPTRAAEAEAEKDADNNGNGTWSSDNKTPNSEQPTTKLDVPTGNFVSNHRPKLSQTDEAIKKIQSSCVTTPGATCQIIFTKDGVSKSLAAQKTDAGGGAYWDWKLQDIGLTKGAWKIQAKATLGTQTETAEDSALLEVQE
jgi:hypothetical protein